MHISAARVHIHGQNKTIHGVNKFGLLIYILTWFWWDLAITFLDRLTVILSNISIRTEAIYLRHTLLVSMQNFDISFTDTLHLTVLKPAVHVILAGNPI